MAYEYRCFPSVTLPAGTKPSQVGSATAIATGRLLSEQMEAGFEFVGAYAVHTEEPAGCLGALFGPSVVHRTSSVLVFRR